jgi:hypothetical protein
VMRREIARHSSDRPGDALVVVTVLALTEHGVSTIATVTSRRVIEIWRA